MREFLTWIGVGFVFLAALLAKDFLSPFDTVEPNLGGGYGLVLQDCDVSAVSKIVVGPAGSEGEEILVAASSTRAWARLQLKPQATSTVFIAFAAGAAASPDRGIALQPATSSVSFVEWGRNTDFPYTGAVTGISNGAASTSLLFTSCRY